MSIHNDTRNANFMKQRANYSPIEPNNITTTLPNNMQGDVKKKNKNKHLQSGC